MSPEQSPSKIGKSVGEKLRAARIAQHYTQSQLAAPDFSVSYISAIERGQIHPSLRALEILANRLGLSSTQLLPSRAQQEDRLTAPLSMTERDDDEVELALLEAHIFIRQGSISQAITLLEKLSTKRLKRHQLLQHRYLLGWAYFKVAQFQECDYILTEAVALAKDLNAHDLHLRILNLQAMTHVAMRNYAQALLAHQRCLNLLESTQPRDPFFAAQVYMSMGHNYTYLENFQQALEMFYKALAITEELKTPQNVQQAYWNLCQHYATAKNYDLATLYVYKCFHLHDLQEWKHLRSEIYHYLGRALIKSRPEQVRAFLDEASQKECTGQDQLTRASLLALHAQWHFLHQQPVEAKKFALQASDLAQKFGDTIIGADALLLLGHIEYAQQHYQQGDQHFVAGLEMLERLNSQEELVQESVCYAQLLEGIGEEHKAFTYFRHAFQSQQKLAK